MFINLLMLAGLAGAAVPVVLHLLSRSRYRTVDWGAMMFLVDTSPRQQQRARIKQWLLLLVRMAIVALLAMALARPVVNRAWAGVASEAPVAAAIVLDRSASMSFNEAGRSRLEAGRDVVLQILGSLKKEDQVALILTGDGHTAESVHFTSDLQSVAAHVADVTPGHGAADVASALVAAATALDRFPHSDRRIYVVCDHQAASWRDVDETFAASWRDRAGGDNPVRLFVLPVGSETPDNVAIDSVALSNPPAIAGSPADVEVTVRNYGELPRAGLPLTLRLGSQTHSTSLNLAPNASSTVRFSVRFDTPGEQVLTAEIRSTGLTADDRFDYVVDAIQPIHVLIVSGDERPEPFRSESDFLRLALAPYQALGREGPSPAVVTIKPVRDWTGEELSQVQVLVLANFVEFTPQQVRAIEQFVYGGGGLLVAPGALAHTDSYNRALYRDGAGVLPAQLEPPVAGDGSEATTLIGLDLAHPVFHFLKGRPDPIPSATISRYLPATPYDTGARVLGTYASGRPFLIESTAGRGRVLLLTTALDADWSTLPLTNFYLPFVQSSIRYLAAGALADRNLEPGQEIRAIYPAGVDNQRVRLFRPEGRQTLQAVSFRGRSEVRVADTDVPGVYRLQARVQDQEQWRQYVVRTPRVESDPAPLPEERWDELEAALGFQVVDVRRQSLASVLTAPRTDRELWLVLLAAVMGLAVLEMGLTRLWATEGR